MADTQVKNEIFLPDHALDGDERLYCVDNPTGTPADRRIDALATFPIFRRPNRSFSVYWAANYGAAAQDKIGPNTSTYGSTFGANGYDTINERSRRKRTNYQTGTSAGSSAGLRAGLSTVRRGDAAGRGGFRLVMRFAMHTLPASWRAFAGLAATTSAFGNADPSSFASIIGIGKDAADTAWQIMFNDATGAATKVALDTTNYPIGDTDSVFELELYCPPGNNQSVTYTVRRVTGVDADGGDTYAATATGTISTDMPATAVGLCWHLWLNNDVTTTNSVIEIMRVYLESYGD